MSTFCAVNPVLTPTERMMDHQRQPVTPTTPRPDLSNTSQPQELALPINTPSGYEGDSGRGTTGGISPKRSNASTASMSNVASTGSPGGSQRSREGSSVHSSIAEDNAGGESDGEHGGSENGIDLANSGPPSKKKKGQRFFCTDYPPCTLSFTRSEHLARHIRKHTGERPFQCHCTRRFSRLDNLRQHAQTVHLNEDIPGDSLAATGTRFQRQVRTDRMGARGRVRAGTTGSQGGHSRGHSRNLSTSSIASTVSTYSQPPELRRRPPPLIMANDASARARLSLETMASPPRTPPNQVHGFTAHSPASSYYTPSTVYPAGADGASAFYPSPASATSGIWGERGAGRRLSVPSGTRPFEFPHPSTYPPPYPRPIAPSNAPQSNTGSIFGSPTGAHTPSDESNLSPSEVDWRRKTWHASSQSFGRPATSGLWFNQSADAPQPGFSSNVQPPREPPPRLPGIESFDQVQLRPTTPPRREPTPMQIDGAEQPNPPATTQPATPAFPPVFSSQAPSTRPPPPISGPGHRRAHVSFDMTFYNNLTKLDIRGNAPSNDASQWSQQTISELQNVASQPHAPPQQPPSHAPSLANGRDTLRPAEQRIEPTPTTPTQNKRHGWLTSTQPPNGPAGQVLHASPEDSSSSEGVVTPSAPVTEYQPAISHNNNDIERHHSHAPTDGSQQPCVPRSSHNNLFPANANSVSRPGFYSGTAGHDSDMGRLEALVAVATSESTGTKFF
ncbi:hypothetical protein AJ80_03138 [Polytolypa hystricis UAMH7299]|uniref:C2H2-type domain-containing protein n=1 Tax=Polytolypa hystricis (strain UAMH7299) TaxID=1447883 RepID=A0A2B7YL52_POLH7|nr:hypothetical protein AJ80_03138 [Polytolypa hystricis UAMH7299]